MNTPEFKFALREDLKDKPEFLPTRSNQNDTGFDVRCAEPDGVTFLPFECKTISLGIRAFCPEGYWYELKPRSSTFVKKNLHCLYGTIDECYGGTLMLAAQYIPLASISEPFLRIEFGERIGQIIPVRRQEMIVTGISNEEIERLYLERNSSRGAGGFGSSGQR
jgi:dUTP pyrophosphatase